MESQNESRGTELANEIYSFKELITIIVEYYCFKNNIDEDDELDGDTEGETWKRGTKYDEVPIEIVPEEINDMIEQSFKTQLKKFI